MSFLDVDALREGSEMPLSEEYGENLSLSLSLLFVDKMMVHMSWTLLMTAWKDEKTIIKK